VRLPLKGLRRPIVRTLTLLLALASGSVRAQPPPPSGAAGVAGDAEIVRALAAVKADPDLAASRTVKTLKWKADAAGPRETPGWVQWFAGLASWLNQSTRVLIWIVIAVLLGLLAAFFARSVRTRPAADGRRERTITPTHVQDLDIRPETLPPDVGAAARALWDEGHHRTALALLYRGLLSRLAHVHRMPIRDSSTEGECLAFSAGHLPLARHDYVDRLVRVWQHAVYGHEGAQADTVHALCDGFGAALDSAASETPS
jgi:hypothetical protein